ncbi:MAG: hypothetical protein RIT81_39725 [Deltaproteobacteria bacterium]
MKRWLPVLVMASSFAFAGCATMAAQDDKPKICRTVKRTGSRIARRECTDDTRGTSARSMDSETYRQSNRGGKPGAVPSG